MRRRDCLYLIPSAGLAAPFTARAQQPEIPLIGYLHLGSLESSINDLAAFRKGLSEIGFVEGRNVSIEYRFAQNGGDRLSEFAADLVSRQVALIVATPTSAGLAAKSATTTIPIVFIGASDPVQAGLVASLNRPGGNITGIGNMGVELGAKRLGLLHELIPRSARIAVIVNPIVPTLAAMITEVQAAGTVLGKQVDILRASTGREIDAAYGSLVQNRADAVMVTPSPVFVNRRVQLITLAARHMLPAIYHNREIAEAGGLMSYGPATADLHRQVGIYAGRILKGEKPADLPVMQPVKFELIINLQTAKTLGIEVPPTLLAIADGVIE